MKCSNCGAPIEKDFNMCPYCGMSMKDMIDAEDVYDKMDDMDDKLDSINTKLDKNGTANPSAAHQPSKAEETAGKVATAIFFVVFFIVLIIILTSAMSMCSMNRYMFY